MSITVRIPAPLRALTDGQAQVSVPDVPTVEACLTAVESAYPALKERMRDATGALRRHVNLYVNGEDIRFLNGIETPLKAGDEVAIIPAMAGGGEP